LLVELIDERTLDAQGGARQSATYIGRLVGAFMEWGAVVPLYGDEQKPVEEDSVFDWRSPRYDMALDTWVDATEYMTVTAAKAGGWPTQPMGEDFTDSTGAMMIGPSTGSSTDAPLGTWLAIDDVDVPISGRYGLEVLMDNEGTFWDRTVQLLDVNENDGFFRVSYKLLEMTEGPHRLAFEVRNISGLGGDNPTALAYNLFKTDQQGFPIETELIAMSDSTTQICEYPDPFPGMTPGDDLLQLLATLDMDYGCLTWVIPTFGAVNDSNGDPFPRDPGLTTKTATTSLLSFLDEMAAGGRISRWRFRPDGVTLDVFAPGYMSGDGALLEPAPVDDPRSGAVIELNRRIT
jgi:hypothetical protein